MTPGREKQTGIKKMQRLHKEISASNLDTASLGSISYTSPNLGLVLGDIIVKSTHGQLKAKYRDL